MTRRDKEILRRISRVRAVVERKQIEGARSGGKYASGLSSEGYTGGYMDALDDVALLISCGQPQDRRGYWRCS